MLKEKLGNMVAQSASKIPAEAKQVMADSTQGVAQSIAGRNIPKVGDVLPAFELVDSQGNPANSGDLIGDGHLVLSFFRGVW